MLLAVMVSVVQMRITPMRTVIKTTLLFVAGCGSALTDSVPREAPVAGGTAVETVRIDFWNLSRTAAVDVEFFAANEPLATLPDDLWVPAYRVTASVGVAGTGILEPGNQDSIEFACMPGLTVGTAGGRFLDNETGEFIGSGTARWVQEQPLGLCGSTVTLVFTSNDNGLVTRLYVGPLVPQAP
jgi:hypothetical protein